MPPFSLEPRVLENAWVRLEPVSPSLRAEVRAALDCDPETWRIMVVNAMGADFAPYWDMLLGQTERGERIAFAVRRQSDARVVGTSSFLRPQWANRGIEIGTTFLHPDARAGAVNPAAKLAMLSEAFERGALRVEIITDVRNTRSAAAIAKLGAKPEGVLRKHKITWTGHVRDSAVFSIVDTEWAQVRSALEARLAALAAA